VTACEDGAMDQVVISYNGRSLTIGEVSRDATGDIWSLDVEIADSGLRASIAVTPHYAVSFDDLVRFFADLERHWRGWDGDRVYESLEGEFRIAARHLGGRVQLTVDLGKHMPDDWRAQVTLTVDAGEQLRAAADDLAALLGPGS
jgi:uncharacterized protein DUF6228